MDALIYAKAGLAVYKDETNRAACSETDGNSNTVMVIARGRQPRSYPVSALHHMLDRESEARSVTVSSTEELTGLLENEAAKESALLLCLILLDESEDDETVCLAAKALDPLLTDDVTAHLKCLFGAHKVPATAAGFTRARKLSQSDNLRALIELADAGALAEKKDLRGGIYE